MGLAKYRANALTPILSLWHNNLTFTTKLQSEHQFYLHFISKHLEMYSLNLEAYLHFQLLFFFKYLYNGLTDPQVIPKLSIYSLNFRLKHILTWITRPYTYL